MSQVAAILDVVSHAKYFGTMSMIEVSIHGRSSKSIWKMMESNESIKAELYIVLISPCFVLISACSSWKSISCLLPSSSVRI